MPESLQATIPLAQQPSGSINALLTELLAQINTQASGLPPGPEPRRGMSRTQGLPAFRNPLRPRAQPAPAASDVTNVLDDRSINPQMLQALLIQLMQAQPLLNGSATPAPLSEAPAAVPTCEGPAVEPPTSTSISTSTSTLTMEHGELRTQDTATTIVGDFVKSPYDLPKNLATNTILRGNIVSTGDGLQIIGRVIGHEVSEIRSQPHLRQGGRR